MKLYADRPSAVIYLLACLFFPETQVKTISKKLAKLPPFWKVIN